MLARELHNIDCIEIPISGAGDYFIPRPVFHDKKIDSLFLYDGRTINMSNNDLYVSIYSIEKKPLYINAPAVSFNFYNINNYISAVIDFDLFKITYTGSASFTLYCYFSTDEKMVDLESIYNKRLSVKNLKKDILSWIEDEYFQGDKFFDFFSDNDANFFRGKKVRMISSGSAHFFISLVTKSGKSFKNIPFQFLIQSPASPYVNLMPFLMNDEIDLDKSTINIYNFTSSRFDLALYYE